MGTRFLISILFGGTLSLTGSKINILKFFSVIKFTLFFLSLSLLIILHEFGHYITARWFKAKVDKFYLFFDFLFPFPNMLKFSLFKKKIGETEYGIGWFPFGGYVDIAGMMADTSDGKPATPPGPHEFRGKKPWQRLIILAGGISVNVLLAIIIYIGMSWAWGEEYLPTKNVKYGFYCDTLAIKAGFQNGDKIISFDNKPVENSAKLTFSLLVSGTKTVQVLRDGKPVNITLPASLNSAVIDKETILFDPMFPFVIDSIVPKSGAETSKLMKGDSLFAVNNDTLPFFQQYHDKLQRFKNDSITLHYYRRGIPMTAQVKLDSDAKMGIYPKSADHYLQTIKTDYSFFGACVRGPQRAWESLEDYVKQLKLVFTKSGVKKIGGFATIGKIFPSTWDWEAFWRITAFLSMVLAFMNLLPIPVLDGGYILFVLWEMITRKKVSEKFMQGALTVGMYLVLALLLLANGNDIYRYLIK